MRAPGSRNRQTFAPLSAEALSAIERRGFFRHGPGDLYFELMTMPAPVLAALLLGNFFLLNLIFAGLYFAFGGLGGGDRGLAGDFFYSVQTLSTTGYGAVYPVSFAANVLTSAEIVLGQLNLALTTGVLFARLSRPRPRVLFSQVAVVRETKEGPVLMLRIANQRHAEIMQAKASLVLVADEDDGDGGTMRRLHDLKLERSETPAFSLSWLLSHRITPQSPLHGRTMAELMERGGVIICSLAGIDDALSGTVTARHVYGGGDIRVGHRFVDVIKRTAEGRLSIDIDRFHDTEALENTYNTNGSKEISGNND